MTPSKEERLIRLSLRLNRENKTYQRALRIEWAQMTPSELREYRPTLLRLYSESTAGAAKPDRAEIPGDLQTLRGTIEIVYSRRGDNTPLMTNTKTPQPFRKVSVAGVQYCVFDNKEKFLDKIDGERVRLFDLLDKAKTGDAVAFLWREEGEKKIRTAKIFTRVGDREWENDGTPVLQRGFGGREPGEEPVY